MGNFLNWNTNNDKSSDLKRNYKFKERIIDLLNQPNYYVTKNLISIFKKVSEKPLHKLKNMKINISLKLGVSKLINDLEECRKNSQTLYDSIIEEIKELISQYELEDNFLWTPANILFELPSIMKLDRPTSNKLLIIIKNIKSLKEIDDCFDNLYKNKKLNQSAFEKEVKQYYSKGLTTLINKIFLNKQKSLSLFEKLTQNKLNLSIFENQNISILDRDYLFAYEGKIISCELKFEEEIEIISIDSKREEANIKIYLEENRISNVIINIYSFVTVKDLIYELYGNFIENDIILEKAFIKKNNDYKNSKYCVLEDSLYNVIMGKRFSMNNGHYLIFQNLSLNKNVFFEVYENGIINEDSNINQEDHLINIKNATIQHQDWENQLDFEQYLKYYTVGQEKRINLFFNLEDDVDNYLQIKEADNSENDSFENIM